MIAFTQTSIWSDINKHCNEEETVCIEVANISCLFGLNEKNKNLVSYGGPTISANCTEENFHYFLSEVIKFSERNRVKFIAFRSLYPLRCNPNAFENIFFEKKFKKEQWSTFIINLSPEENIMFNNFKHAARKGIKKANNIGVRVERCATFEDYYHKFLIGYYSNQGRSMKDQDFYKKYWDLDEANIYNYWVAYSCDNEILGFLGTYSYQQVATEIMSAISPLAFEGKIPVQDIMHWEIMKFHKTKGDLYFDLAGFNPNPISEKEKNIKRFKEKWNGKTYDCSSFIYDCHSILHKIINKLRN